MKEKDVVEIDFKGKIINLHFEQFDLDIDVDELCRIDHTNLYAELITIPALMNRVGLLKAQAENDASEAKLERDFKYAELEEMYRKELIKIVNEKTKNPSNPEVEAKIMRDPIYQNYCKKRIRKTKEAAFLDSLYWAVKSKESKLNKIGERMSLTPEDFEKELVECKINGIMIRAHERITPNV